MSLMLRYAIDLSLEAFPGSIAESMSTKQGRDTILMHAFGWIRDYAIRRGVMLESQDVVGDIRDAIADFLSRRASTRDHDTGGDERSARHTNNEKERR